MTNTCPRTYRPGRSYRGLVRVAHSRIRVQHTCTSETPPRGRCAVLEGVAAAPSAGRELA
eukprot:48755-Eustigmatos_ZCMA.PRE.1